MESSNHLETSSCEKPEDISDSTSIQTNYGVSTILLSLARGMQVLKNRALESENNTQAVVSLLDDANILRNELSRKNDIAQTGKLNLKCILQFRSILMLDFFFQLAGLNDGLLEIVKHTYSTLEILRPIESEYTIQEETRRLAESEAKVCDVSFPCSCISRKILLRLTELHFGLRSETPFDAQFHA